MDKICESYRKKLHYMKEYYLKNRERILEQRRKHKPRRTEWWKGYYENNKERILEKNRLYRLKKFGPPGPVGRPRTLTDEERVQAGRDYRRKYYHKNKEKRREQKRGAWDFLVHSNP